MIDWTHYQSTKK